MFEQISFRQQSILIQGGQNKHRPMSGGFSIASVPVPFPVRMDKKTVSIDPMRYVLLPFTKSILHPCQIVFFQYRIIGSDFFGKDKIFGHSCMLDQQIVFCKIADIFSLEIDLVKIHLLRTSESLKSGIDLQIPTPMKVELQDHI